MAMYSQMHYPTDVDLLFLIRLINISNFRLARVNNTDSFVSFISFIEGARKGCRHTTGTHSHVGLHLLDHTALNSFKHKRSKDTALGRKIWSQGKNSSQN